MLTMGSDISLSLSLSLFFFFLRVEGSGSQSGAFSTRAEARNNPTKQKSNPIVCCFPHARLRFSLGQFKMVSKHSGRARMPSPAVGAADAEIKVPTSENTELEGSSFKAWGRSAL